MRILLYEEWEHFIPTLKSWSYALTELGHDVFHFSPNMYNVYGFSPLEEYDLIIATDLPVNDSGIEVIKQLKLKTNAKKVVGLVLNALPEHSKYKGIIDYLCSLTYSNPVENEKFIDMGFDLINIPLAANTNVFHEINDCISMFDISFVGQFGQRGHGYRRQDEYLYPILEDKNLRKYLSGFTYNNQTYSFTPYNKLNEIYNSSLINLNFHYDNQKGTTDRVDFNGRTFEICAAGGFQICDHPYINQLIPSMIVETDGKKWKDLIYYYLNHEYERKLKAHNCMVEVLEKHTYVHRMKTLFGYMGDIK